MNKPFRSIASHAPLLAVAITMMLPFAWMLLASFKTNTEIEGANLWPEKFRLVWNWDLGEMLRDHWNRFRTADENYVAVFKAPRVSFGRYYFNSLFVAAWVTFLTCFSSSLAAYAFSRLRWRGRDTVFLLYLGTLMVPGIVTMIPNFALMVRLHLLDTYAGLIVPASFSAFGVFLLRQFMLTIPTSLDEAASIDGASKWSVFWDIILPLTRPGLITLAILAFLGNYGNLQWPLVMVKSESLRTLPVGMLYFDTQYGRATNLIMAGSVLAIIPPLILFVLGQKFLVKGIQLGAVKG
jgi:ABC-type glycerol-3-phosphate transport system permease component